MSYAPLGDGRNDLTIHLSSLLVLSAIGLRIIGALSRQSLSLLGAQSYRDRAPDSRVNIEGTKKKVKEVKASFQPLQ